MNTEHPAGGAVQKSEIVISHTPAQGVLVDGSTKGDGVFEILKGLRDNWRYFRSLGQIGIGQSRDKPYYWVSTKIERAANALRAEGFEVVIESDDEQTRSFAEAEADRYDRAEGRELYHWEKGRKAEDRAAAAYDAEHRIIDGYPMGQPILVGHHSERRHRRDLARAEAARERGTEEAGKARYHADRERSAAQFKNGRENLGVTLRRIGKLEAERRRIDRKLNGSTRRGYVADREPVNDREYRAGLNARLGMLLDELGYWRAHVEHLEAEGAKVYTSSDFNKGDWVRDQVGEWREVKRVNPKSVTVPNTWFRDGVTQTLPYDSVTGKKTAAEMADIRARQA